MASIPAERPPLPALSYKEARGEICEQVISEVKQIKQELSSERRTEPVPFHLLRSRHQDFKVLETLSKPPFREDDREYICHPAQWWRKPTGHAFGILKRHLRFSRNGTECECTESTLKGYRLAWNRYKKRHGIV